MSFWRPKDVVQQLLPGNAGKSQGHCSGLDLVCHWPFPHPPSGLSHLISPSVSGSPREASWAQGYLGLELCIQLCSDTVCVPKLWGTGCSPALGSVHWLLSVCPRLESLHWDQGDSPGLSWWRGQE